MKLKKRRHLNNQKFWRTEQTLFLFHHYVLLQSTLKNPLDRLSITEDTIRTHNPSQKIQLLFRMSKELQMWIICQAERWKVQFDPKFLCIFSVCHGYQVQRLKTKTFRTSKLTTTPQIKSKTIKNSSSVSRISEKKHIFLIKLLLYVWNSLATAPTAVQPFMQICVCSLKQGINTILEKHA